MGDLYCLNQTKLFADTINCSSCLISLNVLINKEGFDNVEQHIFPDEHLCVDMDNVEKILADIENRNRNKSMDSAYVLRTGDVVLVEYRFNYQNLRNLKSNTLILKRTHSEQIVKKYNYSVHSNFYYVFNRNVIEQAKRRFYRFNPKLPQIYKAVDLQDLKLKFWPCEPPPPKS